MNSGSFKLADVNSGGADVVVDVLGQTLQVVIWIIALFHGLPEGIAGVNLLLLNLVVVGLFNASLFQNECVLFFQLEHFLVVSVHLSSGFLNLAVLLQPSGKVLNRVAWLSSACFGKTLA